MFKCKKSAIILILPITLFIFSGISYGAEQVVRTIKINYPSKAIEGSTTVVTVPGCRYDFTVVGDLPAGTWIEWRDATTTKGKWVGSTLYPYETGGGGGTYSITAVLCGGAGPGPGWQVTVSGVITDPVLTFSEPGIDQYFIKDQTDPKPEVDMKVSVVKPDGTKLEGVNVIFVAQKASDGTIVNIGSQSSTTGGIAAKIWDVPVSSVETFTLYASTGGVWPNLENKATGKKAIVYKVEIDPKETWLWTGSSKEFTAILQGIKQPDVSLFKWSSDYGKMEPKSGEGSSTLIATEKPEAQVIVTVEYLDCKDQTEKVRVYPLIGEVKIDGDRDYYKYKCNNCGYESSKEFKKCPECKSTDVRKYYHAHLWIKYVKDGYNHNWGILPDYPTLRYNYWLCDGVGSDWTTEESFTSPTEYYRWDGGVHRAQVNVRYERDDGEWVYGPTSNSVIFWERIIL